MISNKVTDYLLTVIVDEESTNDGATAPPNAVVDPLQDSLGLMPQVLGSVVSDVGAASRPHGGVGDA